VTVQVIVLNGGSSSGKSSIARHLQSLLAVPWLTLGVDNLVAAMPPAMQASENGLKFLPDGQIEVGPGFGFLERAWSHGAAAMARAGVGIILDEVFLSGAVAQNRWKAALHGLEVLWVGIRCDPLVAAQREASRGDRVQGMAALQAQPVHQGVAYDLEIDTTHASPRDCARLIADRVMQGWVEPATDQEARGEGNPSCS
jgi:chloramphenicol 3-O phosphotransferase